MDTVGAVTVPTIVAANHQATAASTNAINVNQSNSSHPHTNTNPHPHILTAHSSSSGSNSNNNNNNSNSSSSIINTSLIISSNSSSSSSSSSSASSGYGSTSATPTNSYETHTAASTPVAIAEPIIPIATVAAVSPYFSESITTQALEGQHYAQHHHQQQQQHVNPHQQHQPQSQLHHHQLQQNLQHTQRQQYYSNTYDYQQQQPLQQQQQQHQQQQPTHQQQQQQSHNLSLTYNMGSGSPAIDSASSATSSSTGVAYQGVGQYKPTDIGAINYERNLTGRSTLSAAATGGATAAPTLNYQQPMQQQIPNASSSKHLTQSQHQQQQFLNATSSSKSRSASSLLGSSSSTTTKPQAAATPFYAQPLAQQSNNSSSFYDNLKHKMPLDYHDNFVNFPNAAAYHQQQKYYAAAKSQLKEASTYGSPPGLTGKSLYPNANTCYTGPTAQHASGGYDKYMYPSAYPTLAYETPPDPAYRKGNTTGSINSHSWPWGIDYASGNSRTIPPPTSHIPTATVAPTHASYLTANTSHLTRDPYYMAHDKYGMKYDKYPPPYQQTYVSPPATRHHLWPGTHSALSERLPPPPHTLHSTNYYSANAQSVLNARQSCCTQPYQPQSCYYPPTRLPPHGQPSAMAQTSAYMGTAQPTAHPHQSHLSPLGSSCKYGSVIDYGAANKLKNPNDLYLSTRYDANPPPPPHLTHNHSYNYGTTAAAANQLYNPNQIHHGAQPAGPLITHESLVNTPNFTNDLSLTSNTFDSYHHDPPHMNPQGLSIPSGPTASGYAPAATKRALLDYRKPIQPQPPPAPIPEECFGQAQNVLATSNISADSHYQSTELLNTPETTTFIEYDAQTQATGYAAEESPETLEQPAKSTEETTKNVSLRDFIANWNDDEDEYAANEDMAFDQSTVINDVLKATTSAESETEPAPEPVLKAEEIAPLLAAKVSVPQNISKVSEVVSETTPSAEIDSSQYVNLPDIIIDIEKANVNTSLTMPPSTGDDPASLLLDNFDVEKELDQLQLRKNESDSIIVKHNHDINPTKDSKNDISHTKCKDSDPPKTSQISFDDFNLEQTKAVLPTRPTSTDHLNSAPPQTEQLLRDIEGYDSGNSRHSNESSLFEKEYETFINKITTIIPNTKSESEFEENVQEFSKFYKRKRKLRDEEVISPQGSSEDGKKLKSCEGEKVKNSNFPQVYTKKSRNRRVSVIQRLKQNQIRRRKPSSMYYKLIHSLKRYRRYRSKRVRDYIAELKEKHLPLIKRQSIKNYSIAANQQASPLFNPQSLKTIVLSVINSEVFRDRLMILPMEVSLESEKKHICTDPACETCDVIRSLMEPEAFEESIMEQENIVNESAKIDVCSENELIYTDKQREDLGSQPQLISEQVNKPIGVIPSDEVETTTDERNEIGNTTSPVDQKYPDELGSSNLPTTTSVSNNIEGQHVGDYMEVQDLSLPQTGCGLTSVVKNTSLLGYNPICLEKNPNDSEKFPEDAQCQVSNVMYTPEIRHEIPSVIQTTSVISTTYVQNDDTNLKSSKAQQDSKLDYPEVAGITSGYCKIANDNALTDAQCTESNMLSTPEINPETSLVIQKTSLILTEVQNDESKPESCATREESTKEYPAIAEMDCKIDKDTSNSAIKTLQNEGQDVEIPKLKSLENQQPKDEKSIKLNNPLNIIELDSDSDSESESESSECDTDCSCSSCSSSESSDEDEKVDQDKSRTSSGLVAEEDTENNSSRKKENLKRKTSKLDTESCPKVLILNRIESPAEAKKSCIKADLMEVETITIFDNEPDVRKEISENSIADADNNRSESFNEESIASEPKDIVTESKDIKTPDVNCDELENRKHLNETNETDSSSVSSDSSDSSDDNKDSSESGDEVKVKAKSQTHQNFEERNTDAEESKYKTIHCQDDDDHPQDSKDFFEEETISTTKEGKHLTERLEHDTEYGNETNSPQSPTPETPVKGCLIANNEKFIFPQYSESANHPSESVTNTNASCYDQTTSQSTLGGSHNEDVEQIAADIPSDGFTRFSQESYQSLILKNREPNSLSTSLETAQEYTSPREPSMTKYFPSLNEDMEKVSMEHLTPEKDEAVDLTKNEHEENNAMTSNTSDIHNIEPLDYSTLREDKLKETEDTRGHDVINISEDASSTKNSQSEVSESEPVRPRIILSIKRTPEIVETTKDATSSEELNSEPKGPYEKYYYTTKFKSSHFTNDISDESQSSFSTENDESEREEEEDFIDTPRSDVTPGIVADEINSNSKYKFSPSTVATSTHIFAKDNSLSSKDFNSLNLSEIDERMGDLFPQRPFGCASPIFDNAEESRLSTKSDSSVNTESKGLNRHRDLQSLQKPEDDNKSPVRDLQEPSIPSFEPCLLSNTEKFFDENFSILQQQDQDKKQSLIQSATVIMDNAKVPKTIEDSHRNSGDFVSNPADVSQNIDECYRNPWTSHAVEACIPNDQPGEQEYCEVGEQSIANNFKLPTLVKNLPEYTNSSEIWESLRKANDSNKDDSVSTHKSAQYPQHSENSVSPAFCNDFEKPHRFEEDIDANSKSSDSYLDNENENFASEVQEIKKLDDDHERPQLTQDTRPEKYLPVLEDNEVTIQDNSLSSATSNEDYVNTKNSNINRCDNDTPEGSMWNRVSVISFSHSNTEASDLQMNEEVKSRRATTDKSLDIFDESINSNLTNSIREEHSDSNTCDDDSLDNHIKIKTEYNVEKNVKDLGQFNFHSIFGNLEKLVGDKCENDIGSKKIHWISTQQMEVPEVRGNSAECKELEAKEVPFELTSTSKEANNETNTNVPHCSTSPNESLEESIHISQELEKQNSFQESKCETSEQTSGNNSVIIISDSPESPVNELLLPQEETTTVTQLHESHASTDNNVESPLTFQKLCEPTEARPINEIPLETVIHHQDMSLLNQLKPDPFECKLVDPPGGSPTTSTKDKNETIENSFTTELDSLPSSPAKSDTSDEHEVETEEVLAETSVSQPTLTTIQSNTTNDKDVAPLENIAAETFHIQQCMSPISPTKTDTSAKDEESKPLEESFSETFDPTQTTSDSSPTNSGTLTSAEVDTQDIGPESSFSSQKHLGDLQPDTRQSKEVGSRKEAPTENDASQKYPFLLSPVQTKTSENLQETRKEEHLGHANNPQVSPTTLGPNQGDSLRSKENEPEDNGTGDNQDVALNLHKPNEYLKDFNQEFETQGEFSNQTLIAPHQSATFLSSRETDTLRSKEYVAEDNGTGDNLEVALNLHKSNEYLQDFNKEVERREKAFVPVQSPTTLSPKEAATLWSNEDVPKDSCTGDNQEVAQNLHKPNENVEDFNKKIETQKKFTEETLISEQSPTTLSPKEAPTLRSNEDAPKNSCSGDNQEVAHNIHMANENLEDINKEMKTLKELSEVTLISEQPKTTLSPREADTLRPNKDVPKNSCTGDNQEVGYNLYNSNESFEDFNKEMVTQKMFPKETFIPEQSPTTLSPKEAPTLRSYEDAPRNSCSGDNQEVAHNLHKPEEYLEDINKEMETQKEFSDETFISEQSKTTLSPREAETLRPNEDVPKNRCIADNQEVEYNLNKPNENFEDFDQEVEIQKELPDETFTSEKFPTTLSPSEAATLRSIEDVSESSCTGDNQEVAYNLNKSNENFENFNKEVETQKELPYDTFTSEQPLTTLSPTEADTLRSKEDVPKDSCTDDNQEVAYNLHKPNNYFEEFSKEVETQESLAKATFIPDQYPKHLSTRKADILEPEKYVPVGNCDGGNQELAEDLSKPNEYFEDSSSNLGSNEPIEDLPVYPRFGRFKNYRSRNFENYNENKIIENSENLDNSKSYSPKAESQCYLQSNQHINRDQSSGYRGLVEENVDLPTVYTSSSSKYELDIVNSIECAEMKDETMCPGSTNLSDEIEHSKVMGPTTPQLEIEGSMSSIQLQSSAKIVASPTEPELEDKRLSTNFETLSEDTAEEELECISPVDTTLEDSVKCKTMPNQENSKVLTILTDEITTTTTQDKTSTTDDMSTDFLGFKNQSSFEDESGDFHGFEDQHEEERIRREIENLNEDSAANDAFSYLGLDGKTSSHSGSMSSDLNELEALEKELSQQRPIRDLMSQDETEQDAETDDQHLVSVSNVSISTNDIEHIKKMLESDEEHADNDEYKDNTHKDDRKNQLITLKENTSLSDAFEIPKLSDLCRAALNSSLIVNNSTTVQSSEEVNPFKDTTIPLSTATSSNALVIERELSVEDALAEMYRQAGVLLSDPEDTDNEKSITNEEAQDVLLINLQEILNSDNDNVYVLQCDMNVNVQDTNNENHLHDDNRNGHASENGSGNGNANDSTERVNTLQLIGILNTDLENPEIHIISSDSESEVIILSDCDTDVEFHSEPFSPPPPLPTTTTSAFISTREYIPFIDDMETNDDSQSDLSTIHHEEIVPDNLNKFLKEEFYRYLHEKYAQKKLSKYYHANRVLRKYKKRYSNKFRQ